MSPHYGIFEGMQQRDQNLIFEDYLIIVEKFKLDHPEGKQKSGSGFWLYNLDYFNNFLRQLQLRWKED